VYGHRRRQYSSKEAAKAGVARNYLLGERAKEPPTVWTKLEILYRLRGRLDDAAVKHAIQLSEDKYCSVAAMLKKTATVSWRYEILPADPSTIQGHL